MFSLYLTIGLLVGVLAGWYVTYTKLDAQHQVLQNQLTAEHQAVQTDLKTQHQALQIQLDNAIAQLEEAKATLTQAQDNSLRLTKDLASLETTNTSLVEKLREQKQEVENLQDKFTIQFRNLANDLLEEKSKKFTDQNKTQLESILKPLGERIQEFEKQVAQTNKESLERNVALRTEIKRLNELNVQVTTEATNLAKAIRGDTKTQGNWGEFILESILEKSGLVRDREYVAQASMATEEGKRYQPDVIIKLPEGKHLIIDAKVSLTNYERFFNAVEESERDLECKRHIHSIRKHIKELSEKNYQNLYDVQGLDFVLLFIPMEPAFSLAVQHDLMLFSEAYEKNIVIVSPSTLIATLRTIANIWKHEYQNQNALEIARQGGALYDKFVTFAKDLTDVGYKIEATQKVYEGAMNKLCEGKDNLIRKVERIKALGARTSKKLDQKLLDRASDDTT